MLAEKNLDGGLTAAERDGDMKDFPINKTFN